MNVRRVPPASGQAPLDGVRSVQELVGRLSPYFLSSSLGSAPGSSPTATGGRTVALTNRSSSSQPRPQDTASIALVAGTLTWTFATKFAKAPIVLFAPIGAPPSGAILYIASVAANAVTITSTVNTDTRTLNLFAVGNPD